MLTAAILAGGKSSRMGANKALLAFHGKPMISAVVDAVRPIAAEVIVVADDGAPYAALGLKTLSDIHKGCGPLGGLHAALTASQPDETLLLACDIPLVSTPFLRYIFEYRSVAPARVPELNGRAHPMCAVYDKRCLHEIERLIAAERLAMAALLDTVGAERISITPDLSCYRPSLLANFNDPLALQSGEAA